MKFMLIYLFDIAPEEKAAAKPKKLKQAKGAEKAALQSPAAKPAKQGKKKSKKAEPVEPSSEEEAVEDAEEDVASSENESGEEDNAEAAELAAQFDSEDEDEAAQKAISQFQPGQDVGEIPKASKKAKKNAKPSSDGKPGVVYVGRIPHGFYEHEMRQYFSQFGPINRLRLSRNKRTGASKHFAFVEFSEESTAEVVSKTMDNYLLFGHVLRCKVVPPEKVHQDLWKGANKRFKKVPHSKLLGKELAKPVTQAAWERRVKKENRRRAAKADELKELGYKFEAPTLKEIPAPAPVEETPAIEAEGEETPQVEANGQKALPEPTAEKQAEVEKTEEPAVAKAPKKATKTKKAKGKA